MLLSDQIEMKYFVIKSQTVQGKMIQKVKKTDFKNRENHINKKNKKPPTLRFEKLPMKERLVRLLLLGLASSAVSVPSSVLA